MNGKRTELLLAAGIVGPVLFWLVVIADGFTEPDYDARKHFISELALGKHGWVQTANFLVVGLFMVFFAAGLHRVFPSGRASLFGPLLVGLFGVGLFVSGIFTTDPSKYPPGADTNATTSGAVHNLAFLVVLISVIAGCLVFSRRFRQEPDWKGYGLYSVITAVLVAVLFVNMTREQSLIGLSQRALVAVVFAWYGAIALRALRLAARVPNTTPVREPA